jgi:lactoylglutathione lyase
MFAAPSSTTTFIKPSLLLNKTTPKNSSSKRKHLSRTKIMAKGSSSYLAPDTYHSMSPSDEELIFLHCMLRSSNLDKTMSFFQALGLKETRRKDSEKGKFTLVFMATSPGAPEIEITYNWGDEEEVFAPPSRSMGHLAFATADIYTLCKELQEKGITILRPPRDGRMAFVKSPDGISVELLQKGEALAPAEPWQSMENTGSW